MISIRISGLAREDLKNIGRYTLRRWGKEQRNNYLSQLNRSLEKLLLFPKMGHPCDEIRQGYRRFREGEHIVFYRCHENYIDIIRILHKNLDVGWHLAVKKPRSIVDEENIAIDH